jgi:hypothetical protein
MGAPWYSNGTQWSVGAYAGATNSQDDLAVIAAAVGWGVDDHGDAPDTATRLEGGMQAGGVIGHRGDADALALRHAGGAIVLSVSPYRCATGTFGGDLDVRLELLDADGGVVAVDAPAQRTDARIACVLPAGDYTLRIAGDAGPWAPADASLGRWSLNGGGGTVAAISGEAGIRRDAPGAPRTSGGASGSEGGCGMGGIAGLLMACLGLGLRRRSA